MSRGLSDAEIEATVEDAERIAGELEALGDGAGVEGPLFSRALRTMARTLRMAIIARPEESVLARMVLGLETTLRRVSARTLEADGQPPSQRATLPPPSGLSPEEIWADASPGPEQLHGPVTRRTEPPLPGLQRPAPPAPRGSEVRQKAGAASKKRQTG